MNKISWILIIIGGVLIVSSFVIFVLSKSPYECPPEYSCPSGDPTIPIWFQPQFYIGMTLIIIGLTQNFKNE